MSALIAFSILYFGQAVTTPAPPKSRSDAATQAPDQRHNARPDAAAIHAKADPPTMALIGFLGDYGDAADGLDPMGLAEHPEVKLSKDKAEHKP
ncbi:MAG: hypothetical protein WBV39_05470 [Rudaea sp.]